MIMYARESREKFYYVTATYIILRWFFDGKNCVAFGGKKNIPIRLQEIADGLKLRNRDLGGYSLT